MFSLSKSLGPLFRINPPHNEQTKLHSRFCSSPIRKYLAQPQDNLLKSYIVDGNTLTQNMNMIQEYKLIKSQSIERIGVLCLRKEKCRAVDLKERYLHETKVRTMSAHLPPWQGGEATRVPPRRHYLLYQQLSAPASLLESRWQQHRLQQNHIWWLHAHHK
jgi:hypothetical protein